MTRKRLAFVVSLTTVGIIVLVVIGLWAAAAFAYSPTQTSLFDVLPVPVACSTRGCITTRSISFHGMLQTAFAKTARQDEPSDTDILTSAVRRHIAGHAFLQSPVVLADARKYRETILHITDEAKLEQVVPVSLSRYDEEVVLPFLQQEALRQQEHAETTDELYVTLSRRRAIILLLVPYRWDTETGRVVRS